MSGRVGQPVQAPKPHDQGVPPFGVQAVFFRGTLAPFFRASESPIAIACLRLVTLPPLPPLPERSVPRFSRRIALFTLLPAALPYLAIAHLLFFDWRNYAKRRLSFGFLRGALHDDICLVSTREFIHLLLCHVLSDAVTLLNFSDQLVPLAVDGREIVVGQFAPLLFHLPDRLFPFAFDLIPVHWSLLN